LSDPAILILATAEDAAEVPARLAKLGDVRLPNASKYLSAPGKFDAKGLAKTFNVDSGYPAAPAQLQTLHAWAELLDEPDPRFRDAYDLFCLRALIERSDPFDYAILLGDGAGVADELTKLPARLGNDLFAPLGRSTSDPSKDSARESILFDLVNERASNFLNLAWELYVTGAAYGISPYSFARVLTIAADAQRIEQQVTSI
jgi:hypothetical protein